MKKLLFILLINVLIIFIVSSCSTASKASGPYLLRTYERPGVGGVTPLYITLKDYSYEYYDPLFVSTVIGKWETKGDTLILGTFRK